MIGFRSQMRGQSRNTFKLLLDPLQVSTVEQLRPRAVTFQDGAGG